MVYSLNYKEKMKTWIYFAMAAFFSVGFSSCRDDYSSDFDDLRRMEEQSASKLDSLAKAQDELRQKQEALNKQQAELGKLQKELQKLQEQLDLLGSGTSQDSTAVGQEQLMHEIKKLQAELAVKLDALAKAQEELQKLHGSESNGEGGELVDTTGVGSVTPNTFDNPGWTPIAATGDYAYTMTVTFELPTLLKLSATADDVIAAFVGDECRGVAKWTDGIYLLDVIGTGNETGPVSFRYWNAGNHYMYESLISIPFTSDFIYGVVDEPKMFNCKQK